MARAKPDTPRLFVYGSLQPGKANAHMLDPAPGTWRAARVRGVLHDNGWGAQLGFPVLELDADGDEVAGHVLESAALTGLWPILDAFEGDDYRRVQTDVTLVNGGRQSAWVYVRSE